MKRLAVLRHAKSSWGDETLDDFRRPLNERGRRAARQVGRELKRRGMSFDLILASTAVRVRETIDGVSEEFECQVPIRFEQSIYQATAETLLGMIDELPEAVEAPLMVGHNPGLERLLVGLTRDDHDGLRQQVAAKFPTGAFAVVELPANEWTDIAPGSGEIVELILPRELD